eukprot:8832_1
MYPNLKCGRSECSNENCGPNMLRKIIDGSCCSSLLIPDNKTITFALHQKYRQDSQDTGLVSQSFSSDPVHDWAASLYVVEEHLKKMQKYYENTLNRTLTHFYGYSDRGEFGCSAFLVGLGHIKQKLGLRELFWTFTCPL